ncbi:hypothetical protein TCSYLVIO_001641 [Trypanosoma cruzi]|nr:hypothetical protein TCSYLVIO_001641 [Trypanosoma cruzi]
MEISARKEAGNKQLGKKKNTTAPSPPAPQLSKGAQARCVCNNFQLCFVPLFNKYLFDLWPSVGHCIFFFILPTNTQIVLPDTHVICGFFLHSYILSPIPSYTFRKTKKLCICFCVFVCVYVLPHRYHNNHFIPGSHSHVSLPHFSLFPLLYGRRGCEPRGTFHLPLLLQTFAGGFTPLLPLGLYLLLNRHQVIARLLLHLAILNPVDIVLQGHSGVATLLQTSLLHAFVPYRLLALLFDLFHTLHDLQSVMEQFTVVFDRNVSALFKVHCAIHRKLLAVRLAECLGPLELHGVALHAKVLAALRGTEAEYLAVIAHKHLTVPRVDRGPAKGAVFNPHRHAIPVLSQSCMSVCR